MEIKDRLLVFPSYVVINEEIQAVEIRRKDNLSINISGHFIT